MFDVHAADLVTIALLVALEGLLSADNAMVLAVLVLGLPRSEQQKALRYGIIGAFAFRALATAGAAYMIQLLWVRLLGGLYLLYLPYQHFFAGGDSESRRAPKPAQAAMGLTAFWATVVRVELTDVVFAIDSILVAVAMSNKLWVIITGGILGIIAMRLVIGQLLNLVRRYPALVDGAFIIIAWVGVKLMLEYLHGLGWIHFEVPKWLSLGLIVVIFCVSFWYARKHGPVDDHEEQPAETLVERRGRILGPLLRNGPRRNRRDGPLGLPCVEDGAHQFLWKRRRGRRVLALTGALAGGHHRRILFDVGPAVPASIQVRLERGQHLGLQFAIQVVGDEVRARLAIQLRHRPDLPRRGATSVRRACLALCSRSFTALGVIPSCSATSLVAIPSMSRSSRMVR